MLIQGMLVAEILGAVLIISSQKVQSESRKGSDISKEGSEMHGIPSVWRR